jgi:DNA polymerase III subunit alpha
LPAKFAHLHLHTEYSILDGACRLADALDAAREMGMDSLAITDHGVMYGALSFYEKALERGMKPIIGSEVYVAPGGRLKRDTGLEEQPYHLVLLAMNNEGYLNLMRIVTRGFTEGFYYRPRVDMEVLSEHKAGLIALSACLKGEVQNMLLRGDEEGAEAAADRYLATFGDGNLYIELMDHGIPEQAQVNPALIELARRKGLPLVATNDVHYVRKEDSRPHDHLLCIQTGKVVSEPGRMRFSTDEFYLKSPDEMEALFPDFPEALSNTVELAGRCDVEIALDRVYLPRYNTPEGYDLNTYLERLAWEGVHRHYGEPTPPEVVERLRLELEVIERLEFAGYFLIVWDFVKYAKEQGIKVGPGRGSAAGSLVAYSLGITTIDPLKYSLLFERFLNSERIALPDIDIDFSHFRRGEVIDYVSDKYGRDRVSPIVTFSRLKAKQAVKDVGRVMDIPYARMETITKMIPDAPEMTIELALSQSQELLDLYDTDREVHDIIDTARSLEGMVRHASVHAAGVVIADNAIDTYSPLSLQQKSGENANVITTQYDMYDVEKLGLLKVDMLGLKTQSLLELAVNLIRERQGIELDLDELPMDDLDTFRLIQTARTVGTFQLASPGMRSLMRDMVPSKFEDIIALIALFRPGPLQSDMHRVFVDQKHGRKVVTYPHHSVEEILRETYGVIVYQEQAMQIAQVMAGYTGLEADELRKAMAKKKSDIMFRHREKFIEGSKAQGVDEATATRVFDLIEKFGGYGFNKSHSTAYALVSYQTAYLKTHYPSEYMAALMTIYMSDGDRLVEYIGECGRMNLKVRPPDINLSAGHFTPGDHYVLFGLSAVRNVGAAVVEQIIECRVQGGPFRSFSDFCDRVPASVTNKKTMESLIKAGAFDSIESDRGKLLGTYDSIVATAQRRRRDREAGQGTLFGDEPGADDPSDGMGTLEVPEVPRRDMLAFEKEMLGVYVSDHPLSDVKELIYAHADTEIAQISPEMDRTATTVGGLISRLEKRYNKQGKAWASFTLEDFSGSAEVLVFYHKYEELAGSLRNDAIVLVKGRLDLKDNARKIIADEVRPLPRSGMRPARLMLALETEKFDEGATSRIKEVLMQHPGEIPVHLMLCEGGLEVTRVKFGELYSVETDGDLIGKLRALLGETAVRVEYPDI